MLRCGISIGAYMMNVKKCVDEYYTLYPQVREVLDICTRLHSRYRNLQARSAAIDR